MTRAPLVLEGKTVGRFRASFLLLRETFRFLCLDKEILWVPILATVAQLFLLGVACVFVFIPTGLFADLDTKLMDALEYVFLFVVYLIGAFTIACAEAVITHIVYTRAHGGNATLGEGLGIIGKNFSALFVWACITSTVGIILRAIAERSALLMRIVIALIGTAWSVLTYFTVPAIVIDKKPAVDAIRHSGSVFRRTWGETLVSNISLGLAFFVMILVLVFILIGGLFLVGPGETSLLAGILFFGALLVLLILSSVLNSILKVLLYMYASEGTVPQNFNKELIEKMLVRQPQVAPGVLPTTV